MVNWNYNASASAPRRVRLLLLAILIDLMVKSRVSYELCSEGGHVMICNHFHVLREIICKNGEKGWFVC